MHKKKKDSSNTPDSSQPNLIQKILHRKFYRNTFLGFSLFFFCLAFLYRIVTGYFSIRPHVDDFSMVTLSIFGHDSVIFAGLLVLYVLSSTVKVHPLKMVLRLSIIGMFIMYCLDLAVFQTFHTRLSFNDVFQYFSDLSFLPGLFNISIFTGILTFIVLIIFIISCIVFIFHKGPQSPKISGLILLAAVFALVFHFSKKSDTYFIHNWLFKNYIEINLGRGLDTPYSEQFIETALKKGVDEK